MKPFLSTQFGPWLVDYYADGVGLRHAHTREGLRLRGDKADTFREDLSNAQEVAPSRPIAAILAQLWATYRS